MAITANLEQRGVRVTISIIDLHCDTILELYEKPHAGSLKQNSLSVDIAKLRACQSLAQFFAVFIDRKVYKIFKWYFIIEIRKFVKAEYWDCECERRYIHPSSDIICPT